MGNHESGKPIVNVGPFDVAAELSFTFYLLIPCRFPAPETANNSWGRCSMKAPCSRPHRKGAKADFMQCVRASKGDDRNAEIDIEEGGGGSMNLQQCVSHMK